LAKPEDILKSRKRLAEIVGYKLEEENETSQNYSLEEKKPDQVFLGLEAGQIVSLADEKIFEPIHPALLQFYRNPNEQLADHLR
jgi:hypothetical protein